jgi:histidinol-phosphate aminotransferase
MASKTASSPRKTKLAAAKPPFHFASEMPEDRVLRMARASIQHLKPYVPGRSIEEVREKYGLKEIIKLGSNENPLGANPKVLKAMAKMLPKAHLYPDGSSRALRDALGDLYGVTRDMVMVGNGSDEILLNIALAFVNPGETVLVSEHTFSEYEFSGRVADGQIVKIAMKDLHYDLEGFRGALALKPKVVFLCNPNNPTGTWFTHDELARLLAKVSPESLVVVDEAYAEFADDPHFPRCLELLPHHPNLIISRTLSKLYGLAGLRLGYGIAHPHVVRECQRVKTPFNVNLAIQTGAVTALTDRAFVKRSLQVNQKGRKVLQAKLQALGLKTLPSQGNFICFEVPCPAVDLCEGMMQRGVIVRALRSFGLDTWCRVTVGTPDQNKKFLVALKATLKDAVKAT